MTHDPLCPAPDCSLSVASCDYCDPQHERCQCQCDLIAAAKDYGYLKGWKEGYDIGVDRAKRGHA